MALKKLCVVGYLTNFWGNILSRASPIYVCAPLAQMLPLALQLLYVSRVLRQCIAS